MKLAICDDDEKEIAELKELLSEYQRTLGTSSIMYRAYQNQEALLTEWNEQSFDAAILDIVMPGINGIELGRRIKSRQPGAVIIYLTSSRDFAVDAYDIHAERYIIKPVSRDKLFEALDYVLKTTKTESTYAVKTPDGTTVLRQDQIVYISAQARKMTVHMADGQEITSIYFRSSFTDTVSELLDTTTFIMPHKSYVINMSYIKRYTPTDLYLQVSDDSPEITVPISRQHILYVKQCYLQFMARG